MSLNKLILRFAAPLPKVEAFERYLFIGPHPDDIEIGAGATAARLTAEGKQVCFLICTDGRFGDGKTPLRGDELAACRREECQRSAEKLGVHDVRFLNLSDGGFYSPEALEKGMAQVIGDFKPDVIFAPDPCVMSEGHADHLNAGNAARKLACFAEYSGIMAGYGADAAPLKAIAFYMTAKPNRFVKTGRYFSRQIEAIFDCHLSQFPKGDESAGQIRLYLNLRSVCLGLRSLKGRAEGFRVLDGLHMHCLPESD